MNYSDARVAEAQVAFLKEAIDLWGFSEGDTETTNTVFSKLDEAFNGIIEENKDVFDNIVKRNRNGLAVLELFSKLKQHKSAIEYFKNNKSNVSKALASTKDVTFNHIMMFGNAELITALLSDKAILLYICGKAEDFHERVVNAILENNNEDVRDGIHEIISIIESFHPTFNVNKFLKKSIFCENQHIGSYIRSSKEKALYKSYIATLTPSELTDIKASEVFSEALEANSTRGEDFYAEALKSMILYSSNRGNLKHILVYVANSFGLGMVLDIISDKKVNKRMFIVSFCFGVINEYIKEKSSEITFSKNISENITSLLGAINPANSKEIQEFIYLNHLVDVKVSDKKKLSWLKKKTGNSSLEMLMSGDLRIKPYIEEVLDDITKNTKKKPLDLLNNCEDWVKSYILGRF